MTYEQKSYMDLLVFYLLVFFFMFCHIEPVRWGMLTNHKVTELVYLSILGVTIQEHVAVTGLLTESMSLFHICIFIISTAVAMTILHYSVF